MISPRRLTAAISTVAAARAGSVACMVVRRGEVYAVSHSRQGMMWMAINRAGLVIPDAVRLALRRPYIGAVDLPTEGLAVIDPPAA